MRHGASRICSVGIQPFGYFQKGASLDLGDFGAIVVGHNGAGKTRLVSEIGRTIDVIYQPREERRAYWLFEGLIVPTDPEQPWKAVDHNEVLFEHPHRLFLEILSYLRNEAGRDGEVVLQGDPPSPRRLAWETILSILPDESETVATVFVSLGFGDHERHWSHFPYLVAASCEIARNGFLGVTDQTGEETAQVRIWYNARPDTTPALCEVLKALDTYEDSSIELGGPLGFERLDPKSGEPARSAINGDLEQLAGYPVTLLMRSRVRGPLEYCTPRLPLMGYAEGDQVVRPDSAALPLRGLHAVRAIGSLSRNTPLHLKDRAPDCSYEIVPVEWLEDEARETDEIVPVEWLEDEAKESDAPEIDHDDGTPANSLSGLLRLTPGLLPAAYQYRADDWELAASVSEVANAIFQLLLPRSPEIFLADLDGSLDWFAERAGSPPFPFDGLSSAQRRWATFSAVVAHRYLNRLSQLAPSSSIREWCETRLKPKVVGATLYLASDLVVLDEPENGLHRAAELPLAEGLVLVSSLAGFKPVIATHSPTFIKTFTSAGAATWRVHLDHFGQPAVESYRAVDLESLGDACGLSAADVIQLVSVFLLVEGEHDKAVLEALFREEFARMGVAVLPLRGVRGVSQVVDSSLLWTYGTARIFVLLDHLNGDGVARVWDRARAALEAGDSPVALRELESLDQLQHSGATERKAVRELFTHAIKQNQVSRLQVIGLSEPDIINYFHPSEILRLDGEYLNSSLDERAIWKRLVAEWRRSRSVSPFKSWLCQRFPGTQIDAVTLSAAVSRWDSIPDDLAQLLHRLK